MWLTFGLQKQKQARYCNNFDQKYGIYSTTAVEGFIIQFDREIDRKFKGLFKINWKTSQFFNVINEQFVASSITILSCVILLDINNHRVSYNKRI